MRVLNLAANTGHQSISCETVEDAELVDWDTVTEMESRKELKALQRSSPVHTQSPFTLRAILWS